MLHAQRSPRGLVRPFTKRESFHMNLVLYIESRRFLCVWNKRYLEGEEGDWSTRRAPSWRHQWALFVIFLSQVVSQSNTSWDNYFLHAWFGEEDGHACSAVRKDSYRLFSCTLFIYWVGDEDIQWRTTLFQLIKHVPSWWSFLNHVNMLNSCNIVKDNICLSFLVVVILPLNVLYNQPVFVIYDIILDSLIPPFVLSYVWDDCISNS